MSCTITFDTLEFVETLEASGFQTQQARGICKAFKRVFQSVEQYFQAREAGAKIFMSHLIVAFDTLEFAKALEAAGLQTQQARGFSSALYQIFQSAEQSFQAREAKV